MLLAFPGHQCDGRSLRADVHAVGDRGERVRIGRSHPDRDADSSGRNGVARIEPLACDPRPHGPSRRAEFRARPALALWLECSIAGAMVVGTVFFVLAWIFSPSQGLLRRWLWRRVELPQEMTPEAVRPGGAQVS